MSLDINFFNSGLVSVTIYLNIVDLTHSLSGHVCSRQKAETYETTYDRAFICPERYTTACGQLDWRRCTKYRVNTCYSPTQKYAIRYYTVEECCPGWKDGGGGACTIPVCTDGCDNGGSCSVTTNGTPGCSCPENYYGSRCQYGKTTVQRILLVTVLCVALCAILVTMLYYYRRNFHKRSYLPELVQLQRLELKETERLLSERYNSEQTEGRLLTETYNAEQMEGKNEVKTPPAPVKE